MRYRVDSNGFSEAPCDIVYQLPNVSSAVLRDKSQVRDLMRPSIHQAVERAIAGLSKRDAIRVGGDEFEVRTLFVVASWQQHTEPCRQAGSLVVGEDSCGNLYLCAPDGSVSFWDHENDEETVLAATMEEFCDSLVEPTPVVLRPERVKSVWIDPEFLAEQRRKGNA
jgi:hypothetical protein